MEKFVTRVHYTHFSKNIELAVGQLTFAQLSRKPFCLEVFAEEKLRSSCLKFVDELV